MDLTNEELVMAIVEQLINMIGADAVMLLVMVTFLIVTGIGAAFEWRTRRQTKRINEDAKERNEAGS